MDGNIWTYFVAALIPMIIGFIWYNPKVFGNTWMTAAKVTQEDVESGNMPLIFGLSYVLSLILVFMMNYFVHHEMQIAGTVFMDPELAVAPDSELGVMMTDFLDSISARYNTFGHGLLHGFFIALFLVLPVMATNAMFERKGFKYIAVNWGYWAVTIMLIGGFMSQFY
ncbi:MAG: DUF1761 domain-containing protein [Flavobacteriales bacterium]|nr:DUF1761 domain-containing protein [Flavobacteriales bacterium]